MGDTQLLRWGVVVVLRRAVPCFALLSNALHVSEGIVRSQLQVVDWFNGTLLIWRLVGLRRPSSLLIYTLSRAT
jgi:hypothetical protein